MDLKEDKDWSESVAKLENFEYPPPITVYSALRYRQIKPISLLQKRKGTSLNVLKTEGRV